METKQKITLKLKIPYYQVKVKSQLINLRDATHVQAIIIALLMHKEELNLNPLTSFKEGIVKKLNLAENTLQHFVKEDVDQLFETETIYEEDNGFGNNIGVSNYELLFNSISVDDNISTLFNNRNFKINSKDIKIHNHFYLAPLVKGVLESAFVFASDNLSKALNEDEIEKTNQYKTTIINAHSTDKIENHYRAQIENGKLKTYYKKDSCIINNIEIVECDNWVYDEKNIEFNIVDNKLMPETIVAKDILDQFHDGYEFYKNLDNEIKDYINSKFPAYYDEITGDQISLDKMNTLTKWDVSINMFDSKDIVFDQGKIYKIGFMLKDIYLASENINVKWPVVIEQDAYNLFEENFSILKLENINNIDEKYKEIIYKLICNKKIWRENTLEILFNKILENKNYFNLFNANEFLSSNIEDDIKLRVIYKIKKHIEVDQLIEYIRLSKLSPEYVFEAIKDVVEKNPRTRFFDNWIQEDSFIKAQEIIDGIDFSNIQDKTNKYYSLHVDELDKIKSQITLYDISFINNAIKKCENMNSNLCDVSPADISSKAHGLRYTLEEKIFNKFGEKPSREHRNDFIFKRAEDENNLHETFKNWWKLLNQYAHYNPKNNYDKNILNQLIDCESWIHSVEFKDKIMVDDNVKSDVVIKQGNKDKKKKDKKKKKK